MSNIEKAKGGIITGGSQSEIKRAQGNHVGIAAAFAAIELPRQFNQLVIFLLDGSGSMQHAGISGKTKGYEVHQSVIKVLERLQKSRNVASFDVSFIAYAAETVEMFPVRRVKDCDLVNDCFNPCEHIKIDNFTYLTEALQIAREQALAYLKKHEAGHTRVLFLLLSDGAINDDRKALEVKEELKLIDKTHTATIFFKTPYWEDQKIDLEKLSQLFARFSNSASDHLSTVDPEEIRAHMIKSVTKVSKVDEHL